MPRFVIKKLGGADQVKSLSMWPYGLLSNYAKEHNLKYTYIAFVGLVVTCEEDEALMLSLTLNCIVEKYNA